MNDVKKSRICIVFASWSLLAVICTVSTAWSASIDDSRSFSFGENQTLSFEEGSGSSDEAIILSNFVEDSLGHDFIEHEDGYSDDNYDEIHQLMLNRVDYSSQLVDLGYQIVNLFKQHGYYFEYQQYCVLERELRSILYDESAVYESLFGEDIGAFHGHILFLCEMMLRSDTISPTTMLFAAIDHSMLFFGITGPYYISAIFPSLSSNRQSQKVRVAYP